MKTLIILDDKNEIIEKFNIPEYLVAQLSKWIKEHELSYQEDKEVLATKEPDG